MADKYVSVVLKEYGNIVTTTLGLLHSTMDYVCPNPDTCSWCNRPPYVPPVLTTKQKIKRWWINKKIELGRKLSLKAKDLGYYEDCDCDY